MNAKLKEIYSLELDHPLESHLPENPEFFSLSVRLIIGPPDDDGEESFDITICTPDWLKALCENERAVWGRHMLIIHQYDFDLIKSKIEHYISSCSGSNWTEVAEKLSRIGYWEFEDYQT